MPFPLLRCSLQMKVMRLFFPGVFLLFSCRHILPAEQNFLLQKDSESTTAAFPAAVAAPASAALKTFVPAGYEILDTAFGDLNGDAVADWLLVLKKPVEEEPEGDNLQSTDRLLLILLGGENGALRLAARNDNVVFHVNDGGMMGDPYTGLTIKNGFFSVEHYGGSAWRWTHITTFKWSKTDATWLLFKEGGDSFHAFEPDKVETKVRTQKDFGKVRFVDFDAAKDY